MDTTNIEMMPTHYESVFRKNPEGVFILEHLHRKFYDPIPTDSSKLDALQLAFQAGQRSVVHHIILMSDKPKREASQPENTDE